MSLLGDMFFSLGPCSGTENCKSSALFIRLRSKRRRRARMPRSMELRASRSIRTSNSTRTESRIPEKVTRSTCCWPSRSQGCRYVGSRRGVETAESATLAGCTAPVGPALSCRLIGIRREWPAYGKFETDVHILIVLASLRSELSPGLDYRTCQ